MIRSTDAGYNGPVVIAVFLEHVACVSLASKSRVEYVNDAVNTIMSGCNNFIVHLGDVFLKCDSCIHILVATVAHVDLGPSLLDMICIVKYVWLRLRLLLTRYNHNYGHITSNNREKTAPIIK